LVSFAFDVPQIAIASISTDSAVRLWSIKDRLPFWSGDVLGEGQPSSIDFLNNGIIIGRKQGTILQLVPIMGTNVLSSVKFTSSADRELEEDGRMFGHVSYDPRIRTLWVANSARASLFAFRVAIDSINSSSQITLDDPSQGVTGHFEQVIEFPTPAPTINITLVQPDDPNEDAHFAVSAFAVHVAGVDQINIERDSFERALVGLPAKIPASTIVNREAAIVDSLVAGPGWPVGNYEQPSNSNSNPNSNSLSKRQVRATTPPLEPELEVAPTASKPLPAITSEPRQMTKSGKEKIKDNGKEKEKAKADPSGSYGLSEASNSAMLKEIRKVCDVVVYCEEA